MKKGFATSAILYTMLLLFLALMTGILNNLQNKKTILDALKKDTVSALEQDTVIDAILDQMGITNQKIEQLEKIVKDLNDKHQSHGKIDIFHEFTSSTEMTYTGASVTIPSNSYFCMTAQAGWYHENPQAIAILLHSTKIENVISAGTFEPSALTATTTYCSYTEATAITYYVWAKFSGEAKNPIYITGFYIPS